MKNDRTSRTSVDLGRARASGPTVRSQLIQRATPQADVSAGVVYGGLSDAFDGFFDFAAGRALSKSAEVAKEAKEQEVLRLQVQAQQDYLKGEGPNPELADKKDYTDAFYGWIGDRDGRRVAKDLRSYLDDVPLGESVFDAGEQRISEIYGEGTGNDVVDTVVFGHLRKTLNDVVETRTKAREEAQLQTSIDALASSVGERAASGEGLTAADLDSWVGIYAQINPAEAGIARARVMGMIYDASNHNDAALSAFDRFITKPGTGNDGKSFMESYPRAYDALQQKMIQARRSTGTLEAVNAYSGLSNAITEARTGAELADLALALSDARQQYGEGSDYAGVHTALAKKIDAVAEAEEIDAHLNAYIAGQHNLDGLRPLDKDMRDAITDKVRELGGAVLTDDPEKRHLAAVAHRNLTKTSDQYRDNIVASLMGTNESARLQAHKFLMEYAYMEAQGGVPDFKKVASKFLFGNERAAALFIRIAKADLVSDSSTNDLFSQYLSSPDIDPSKVGLAPIDSNAATATGMLNDAIADRLDDHFGVERVDPSVLRHVRNRFKFLWARGGSSDDWEPDLEAVTDAALSSLSVSVRNGERIVALDIPMTTKVERAGEQVHRMVKPLKTEAVHPDGLGTFNTIEEAEEVVGSAARNLGYDDSDIGIEPGAQTKGYYPVKLAGEELVLALGAPFTLPDGTTLDIPKTPQDALEVMRERLGDLDGIDFEPVDLLGQVGLRMVYRPVWETSADRVRARTEDLARRRHVQALRENPMPKVADWESYEEQYRLLNGGALTEPSAIPTKDSFYERIINTINERARDSGRVAPSTGITSPKGKTLDEVSQLEQTHVGRAGMRAARPTYARNLYEFLKGSEDFRTKAYPDHRGFVTVGIGFNMDASGARERFAQALPDANFDDIYEGKDHLTDNQVRRLFDGTIGEYEKIVDAKIGDIPLTEHQRIALVSLAFNNPDLVGDNLTAFVQEGDIDGAIREILFRSNARKHKGLQNRRIAEAQMFAGKANPIPHNLIQASLN